MIAARRVVGAGGSQQRYGRVDAGEQPVDRQPLADQPGRADRDVSRRDVRAPIADPLGGRVGVLEARRAGARVGAAGVEDDGVAPGRRARPAAVQSTGAALTRLRGEDAGAATAPGRR